MCVLSEIEHKGSIPPPYGRCSATVSMAVTTAPLSVPGTGLLPQPHIRSSPREDMADQPLQELLRLDDAAFRPSSEDHFG